MKAGWEARVKLREEKRKERERLEEIQRLDDEERTNNLAGWSSRLRAEHEAVLDRVKERKKRRAQLGDRKSAAAQNRMKSLASLAADSNSGKKRKKGDEEKDDGFGRDDSDWAVYRELGGDDSDAEEDDLAQVETLEAKLLQYDPKFTDDDTMEGRARVKNALLNAFVRGGNHGTYDPESLEQSYQINLNVERIRVPETWFQPSMFGVDSAGVGEIAGWLLNGFDDDTRARLMQCIVLSGGSTKLPNLHTRMRNTLTSVLPFRAPLKILGALDGADPRLEAWRGMAAWATTPEGRAARVTRAEYDEHGAEWLKEHAWGNVAV
jgi:actin-related protein 5